MTCSGRHATIDAMALTRRRQVEKMIDAYVAWREASDLVNDAYRYWGSATGSAAGAAFGFYSTALDHEERTAEVHAGLVRRVGYRSASTATIVEDPSTPVRKSRSR
jgi:hypothetical protein